MLWGTLILHPGKEHPPALPSLDKRNGQGVAHAPPNRAG